jgi:transmembrane sensor
MRNSTLANVQEMKGRAALAKSEDSARDEAIAWHLRLDDADEAGWAAFLTWLERDPSHQLEFDRAELAGAELRESVSSIGVPDKVSEDLGRWGAGRKWPLIGATAAVAACLVAALSFSIHPSQSQPWVAVQTSPGEQRVLALADGSRLFLNGGTRVLLNRGNTRLARMEEGEATFDVKHDVADPFTLEFGDARLQDAGTIFNVSIDRGRSRVGVVEGAVIFNPARENVTLTRGAQLSLAAGKSSAILSSVDPRTIGSWRQGQLIYDRELLGIVAADVGRALGTEVSVSPEVAGQHFTGVIRIDRDQSAFFARLGGLLGVKVRRSQAGWSLGPYDRAHNGDPRGPDRNRN